jgi:hypothetical protein
VADSDDDAPEGGEAAALRELVSSEGWRRFAEFVGKEWGDTACIQKITAALTARVAAGDEDGERQTSTQILAAQREIRKLLAWPTARIAALKAPRPKRSPLEALRRIGR